MEDLFNFPFASIVLQNLDIANYLQLEQVSDLWKARLHHGYYQRLVLKNAVENRELIKAASESQYEVVHFLAQKLQPEDLAMQDENHNETALHKAAWNNNSRIMQLLIAKMEPADLGLANSESKGFSALHLAAYNGNDRMVQLLTDKMVPAELAKIYLLIKQSLSVCP